MRSGTPWLALVLASMAISDIASLAAEPRFEAASVRINRKAEGPSRISGATPGRFVVTNTPLRFVILYAYDLKDHQLVAAPDWTWNVAVDVTATYPPGTEPNEGQVRAMVQSLLHDRFGFAAHNERREVPAYILTLARKDRRLGPQLVRSDVDCTKPDAGKSSIATPTGKRPVCGMVATRKFLTGGARTMEQLAVTLQSMTGRPVMDRTGLAGSFDIDLQWMPDSTEPSAGDAPSIFTAVEEQLGLKLVAEKAQVDVLAVDKVNRPDDN